MYNGIELRIARGSTNGHVQTNKFSVRTGRVAETCKGVEVDQGTAGVSKMANKIFLSMTGSGEWRVFDTQTHQVPARKEKQMETFRDAIGINVSGLGDAST